MATIDDWIVIRNLIFGIRY